MFNERGEGVIVRGAKATLAKDDLQPHLSEADALLEKALGRYRSEHKTLLARVVLHKSSNYSTGERDGFDQALASVGIDFADLLTLMRSTIRLLRRGSYPPLRGTRFELDARRQLLYTRGSVPFYATYPGPYVPQLGAGEHLGLTARAIANRLLQR